MKKIWVLILPVAILSCKKQAELSTLEKEIIGKWEIEQYSGYPFTQPVYPAGNGQTILIKENGNFERWKHDTLVFKGHYLVQRKKDCSPRDNDIILSTDESSSDSYRYVDVEKEKLALSTPNCWADGGTAYYRRVE